MPEMEDVLSGYIKLIKVIIQNGTPIIGGGGFELKLIDPICHEGSAMMNRVTNAVTTMDDRDVKSFFLNGESTIGGVENKFS